MASDVVIKIDEKKLKLVQRTLAGIPSGMPRAMSRAINNTIKGARTQITREISSRTRLKQKTVRRRIHMTRATFRKWSASLEILDYQIPIRELSPRQTKKGVTFKSPETQSRQLIEHAFINVTSLYDGDEAVFKRQVYSWGEMAPRYPIYEQYTKNSLTDMYENAGNLSAKIQNDSMVKLEKNIDDQVELLLAKARRSA